MALFVITEHTALPADEAWRRVTQWVRHEDKVPLTRIHVSTPGPDGLGTIFVAHTGLGPLGFDDPMEIVEWHPPQDGAPGACRLQKRGRVMTGWAELHVTPDGDGARVSWREDIGVWRLPTLFDPLVVRSSTLLFARVLRHLLDTPVPS